MPDIANIKNWQINNRFDLSKENLNSIVDLLEIADNSRQFSASPLLSGFKVGAAGIYNNGKESGVACGANHERGAGRNKAKDDAIHGEDALIADALGKGGRDTRLELVAITTDSPRPASSCGRCRASLQTYAGDDLLIVSGGTDSDADMWKISELLPEDFKKVSFERLNNEDVNLINLARMTAKLSFQHFTEEVLGKSAVAIRGESGKIYTGIRVDSVAFYGTDPVVSAISKALEAREKSFQAAAFYSQSGIPTGEERQLFYEACSLLRCENTAKVYLVESDRKEIQVTTAAELLPSAFGPGDLGLNLKIT